MNINSVVEILCSYGIPAEVTTVNKDGMEKKGIIVRKGNISPVFYGELLEGHSNAAAAKLIADTLETMEIPRINVPETWDDVKDKVFLGIRPKTTDEIYAEDFLDLEIYMYIDFGNGSTAKVTKKLLSSFGVVPNEAMKIAKRNTSNTIRIKSMKEVMRSLNGIYIDDPAIPDQIIITNKGSFRGGVGMIFTGILRAAAKRLRTDKMIVIPLSIHELIVTDISMGIDDCNEMVKTINEQEVLEKDRLANHVYVFDSESGILSIGR